jgi:hypothetical protein
MHERVWEPETTIDDAAAQGDEKTDDNGESVHEV